MSLVSVVGATGRQGLAQIRQLAASGHKVRALSRSENPDLGGSNAADEARIFDLYDESTWVPAFEGSDAVFYTHPLQAREDRATLTGRVAAAVKQAGSDRFIWNTSSWIPDKPGDPFTYGNNTVAINEIFRSGVPATIFGSVLFMDNLLTNWARPFIVHEKRYVYPHKAHLLANWISLDDVGKCMVAALDRPDFEGSWLNIGGPQRLHPPEVAATLSKVFGHEIKYDPCTPEEFGDLLVGAFGDEMPEENRAATSAGIAAFYTYNNESPTQPFVVNTDYMQERLPEVEFETLEQWAMRQDWSDEAHRPPAG
ncbi:SDR family oxidoreductase [Parasphingorhabdus halotolerans]|uniref:NmrA family NAD(P)-binding protein n=1 Tax=Parasphingorhabdus halotolerans TaxID=2725558 RepID=A0A6H2DNQ4_9SPHN|nr:NmrA family NAD(P)-binding protein [Parasphingorhabdus halotolerans]QJB69767.1 NmrA family NAD(P)-binding protein [Parasphingorhabdus halotolerans]